MVIGHNSDIAWGFTNLGPDVSDLYTEQFADGGYLVDDVVVAFDTRDEVIEVAGGDPVAHTVRRTRHGPLLSDVSNTYADVATAPLPEPVPEGGATGDPDRDHGKYGVALAWTALQPGRTADAILLLNRARNFEEFRSAAAAFEVPAQNLVYADVDGHVGYQAPGRIPLRRADHDGRWPVPGWDSANDWQGDIPFEQLPWELDPDDGVIVTANNAAITPAQAPWTLTHDWSAGYRAQRIVDLLAASPRSMALQDMLDLQMDDRNGFAPDLVDHLLAIDVSEEVAPARNLLEGWDSTQPVDSAPAAFFNAVWRHLLAATFHDEVPESQWPSGGARWFEVVRGLLDQPESPWWDDVDTVEVEDRFNRGPLATAGGNSIVNANGWDVASDYTVDWVPSMRMVMDLADLDASRWINLTGQSGHAYHPNYVDQAPLWQAGDTTSMRHTPPAVQGAGVATLRLHPSD